MLTAVSETGEYRETKLGEVKETNNFDNTCNIYKMKGTEHELPILHIYECLGLLCPYIQLQRSCVRESGILKSLHTLPSHRN